MVRGTRYKVRGTRYEVINVIRVKYEVIKDCVRYEVRGKRYEVIKDSVRVRG
jgi:hypothetical protein